MPTVICSLCNGREFKNEGAYHMHVRSSPKHLVRTTATVPRVSPPRPSNVAFRCSGCQEIFPSYEPWDKHYKETHAWDTTSSWSYCTKCHLSVLGLAEHFKTSNRHPTCSQCNTGFRDSAAYAKHQVQEHASQSDMSSQFYQPYQCTKCAKNFVTTSLLEEHVKDVHTKTKTKTSSKYRTRALTATPSIASPVGFPCSECDKILTTEDKRKRHLEKTHDLTFCNNCSIWVKRQDAEQHYDVSEKHPKCHTCNKSFQSLDHMALHYFAYTNCKKCRICLLRSDLASHFKSSDNHPTCPSCKVGFLDDASLEKHKSRTCPTCKLKFCKRQDLREHKHEGHVEPSKPLRCTFCPANLPNNDMLKQHMKASHTGLYCAQCEIVFLTQDAKANHVTISHSTVMKSTCETSIQTEPRGDKKKDESNEGFMNENEPPKAGTFCSACHIFVPGKGLEAHFRVSPDHPSCNICNLGFEDNVFLAKHTFASHAELCCDKCDLTFEDSYLLNEHYANSKMHVSCSDSNHGFRKEEPLSEHVNRGCVKDLIKNEIDIPDVVPLNDFTELKAGDGNDTNDTLVSVLSDVAAGTQHAGSLERDVSRSDSDKRSVSSAPSLSNIPLHQEPAQDVEVALQSVAPIPHSSSSEAKNSNCRICRRTPEEPVVTMCGHLFCFQCLVQELSKHGKCPACNKVILLRLQV